MINHFTQYSPVLRESILQKVLSEDKPVSEIAREHGVSKGIIYYWLRQKRKKAGVSMSQNKKKGSRHNPSRQWSVAEKLNAIKATAGLSPEAAASWCREHGIYLHLIAQWEQEFLQGSATESTKDSEYRQEIAELRADNKRLNRDLTRKEKALAETTARLVLKKKLAEFLGEDEES